MVAQSPGIGSSPAKAAGAGAAPVSVPPMGAPGVGLGGAKAPPFILPGEHFAAALVFLLAGALGLVWIAPDLATGRYLMPRVVGITHLFTLGWLTTSIMAALYQLLPVVLAEPIRWQRLAHATFLLFVAGLAAFVPGLIFGVHALLLGGAVLFGSGVLLFVVNLAVTLRRSAQRTLTWWALVFAAFYLFATLVLGLALAGNLRWGYLGGGRLAAMGTHLHVALAGWVLLVVIGVAHRLLPMFLLTHGAGERWGKLAVALVASGTGVLLVLHHGPAPVSRWVPLLLVLAGLAAFLRQARLFYRKRHRPRIDAGMRLAAAGLVLLGAGLVLAPWVVLGAAGARTATAYVLALVLGFSVFAAGHYYKILPFLVWYHRFGPLAGKRPVPRVNELYQATFANVVAVLLMLGAGGLTLGVAFGSICGARAAALVFAAGVFGEALQMLSISRRKP